MSPRSRRQAIGAHEAPDVVDDELDEWAPAPLGAGFVIEDALLADGVDLDGADATGVAIKRTRVRGARLAGTRLRSLALIDVAIEDVDAGNAQWTGARLERVVFERCRLTGFTAPELEASEVLFRDCRLDLANFRHGRFDHVTFSGCVLDEADFAGATLRFCRLEGSPLRGVDIQGATLTSVDLRGCDVSGLAGDATALAGAIIDTPQLLDLAPRLAHGLGIEVRDD